MTNGMRQLKYKAYSFRLSEETKKQLEERRIKSAKSWNLFFKELLNEKYGKD